MIATQLSLALYQFIDALMITSLGEAPLAAIAPAGMMIQIPLAFGSGLLATVATFVSNAQGSESRYLTALYGWIGLALACIIGILVIAVYPFSSQLLGIIPQDIDVLEFSVLYFEISLLSIAPQLIVSAAGSYFLGIDRPLLPMFGVIISCVVNVILNYGLIFGKLGLPALGMRGAAWGTVGASMCGAVFILICYWRECRTNPFKMRYRKHIWTKFLTVGIPAGLHHALDVVAWGFVLIYFIGLYGTSHLAAATVVIRCTQLSFLPTHGVGIALTSLVANHASKGDYQGAEETVRVAFRLLAVYMGTMGLFFIFGGSSIMDWFATDDVERTSLVKQIGIQALIVVGIVQIFDAMYIIYSDSLRGAGDTVWQSVVIFMYTVVVFIGGSWAVTRFWPEGGSLGLWIVDGIFVTLQGLTCYFRWKSKVWQRASFVSLDLGAVRDIPPGRL